jgi:tetratricopeptide (TPR) repeat protein
MSDIFLSYKSEDKAKAKIFAEALERHGYSVWWDRIIPPGRTFDEIIEKELDASKCVVVLWSGKSVQSKWVITEAGEGDNRGILIPVLIEEVKPPLAFRRIEAARLIDWQGTLTNPEFDLLLKAIGEKLGKLPVIKKEDKIQIIEELNLSGQKLYEKGQYYDAIDAWKKVLDAYPEDRTAIDGIKKANLRIEEESALREQDEQEEREETGSKARKEYERTTRETGQRDLVHKKVIPITIAIFAAILLTGMYYFSFYLPNITNATPSELIITNTTGSQNFSIDINQKVNVIWYVNGTEVKHDPNVTTSYYDNITEMQGEWIVTAEARNTRGADRRNWTLVREAYIAKLTRINVSPLSNSVEIGEKIEFKAETLDQENNTINISLTWASSNMTVGGFENNSLFTALSGGSTNVTAANGTVIGNATVIVKSAKGQPPNITSYIPKLLEVKDYVQQEQYFEIKVDQIVNVTWDINGMVVKSQDNTDKSKMLNNSQKAGTYNVTVKAQNANGSTQMNWTWNIY